MNKRQQLGRMGEDITADLLCERGYRILRKNYRCNFGEVDIIAVDDADDVLIFVEVKTRKGDDYGIPCESITPRKQKHIRRTAMCFLKNEGDCYAQRGSHIRFDVCEIVIYDDSPQIRYIEHAF